MGKVARTDALVGRESELRAATHALGAQEPLGAVVAITGEPGIGKSRLLAEVLAHADEAGGLALEGRAAELERDRPFGVVVEALDAHVAGLRRQDIAALGEDVLAELGRVLPSVGDHAAGVQDERYRGYRAVRALLEQLAKRRPVVLALDDLQWADPASLELIAHLLARGPGANVTLVLAYRPGGVPPTLLDAGPATLIELEPLSAADVQAWMGEELDAAQRRHLYDLSGGNPFYFEQLVRAWERSPGAAVPAGVRATVAAEVGGLDAVTLAVLRGGAVAGDPFEPDIAAAAADVDEATVLDALDVLAERRLVLPTTVPRRFRFRHPIVREAVYEEAGGGWRIAAHARAADALAARGATAGERAHHIERSASTGDLEAVDLLAAAADEARSRAPATAARWLGSALRLLPAADDERRLTLLLARAPALASAGELDEAHVAALQALELAGPEPPLVALAAGIEHLMGRNSAAYVRLRAGLEGRSGAEAADLQLQLAVDRVYVAEFGEALERAREAHASAVALGDPVLLAAAAGTMASCEVLTGVTDRAASHTEEATRRLDALTDAELAARIETAYYTGNAEAFYEDFGTALRHFERGLRVSRATGQGHYLVPLTVGAAYVLGLQGRLPEAVERIEEAIEIARLTGTGVWLSWALGHKAWLLALTGDVAGALRAGEEGMTLAATHEAALYSGGVAWFLALALFEAGEGERGRDVLHGVFGGPELPALAQQLQAQAFRALASVDDARANVERAEAVAARGPLRAPVAHAQCARAELDNPELALQAAEEFDALGCAIEAARARLLAGSALGDVAWIERAEATFADHGAEPLRRRAAGALRALGKRPPQRAGAGAADGALAGLTDRQREISRLVADGRTNREIAERLVVTEKTVENHLARIFARLGVKSRTALTAVVVSEES